MEGESGFTRNTIDELHSSDIQGDQMAVGSCVTRGFVDKIQSSDIQGHQTEGESGITRSIND